MKTQLPGVISGLGFCSSNGSKCIHWTCSGGTRNSNSLEFKMLFKNLTFGHKNG